MELRCQAADLKTGSWSWATGGPSAIAGAERTAEGDWHRRRPRDRVTGAPRGREGPGAEGCGLSDLRSTRARGPHRNGASATNPRPRSLPTPERARERMVPGTQRGPRPAAGRQLARETPGRRPARPRQRGGRAPARGACGEGGQHWRKLPGRRSPVTARAEHECTQEARAAAAPPPAELAPQHTDPSAQEAAWKRCIPKSQQG